MNLKLNGVWGIVWGTVTALLSLIIILGGINLALAEGGMLLGMVQTPAPNLTFSPFESPDDQNLAITPSVVSLTQTSRQANPEEPPATPFTCPPPDGWLPIIIEPGDTLESLALAYNSTVTELSQANCLITTRIIPGSFIYIPVPSPLGTQTPSASPTACTPPQGWIPYLVRSGDTLFSLSRAYGISISNLQSANCMDTTSRLIAGQQLYVPDIPTRTPLTTRTATSTFTVTPLPPTPLPPATETKGTSTPASTSTPTPTPSPTNTSTSTNTATHTPSPSPTSTSTSTPSNTATNTPSATPTIPLPTDPHEEPSPEPP